MISNTFTLTYKVQTKSKQLPPNGVGFALLYINSLIEEKLNKNVDKSFGAIDDVSTFASIPCEPELVYSSCYVIHTNVTTAAATPAMSNALEYHIADLTRAEVETGEYDGLFQQNKVDWMGPHLASSRIVLWLYGATSEVRSDQELEMFQQASSLFFSTLEGFQSLNRSIDSLVLISQELVKYPRNVSISSRNGSLRRVLVDVTPTESVLEVSTLVLGESKEFGTFQANVLDSFNRDSDAFLQQIVRTGRPFFSSVYAIEAKTSASNETVLPLVQPTQPPTTGIHLSPTQYTQLNWVNTTYLAIAMAVAVGVILLFGVLLVLCLKRKQATTVHTSDDKAKECAADTGNVVNH